MDEEEYEYVEEVSYTSPQRQFMKMDLAVLGLDLARGMFAAVTSTLSTAQALAAAHANYVNAQHSFMEDAALEIESMTGDSDG